MEDYKTLSARMIVKALRVGQNALDEGRWTQNFNGDYYGDGDNCGCAMAWVGEFYDLKDPAFVTTPYLHPDEYFGGAPKFRCVEGEVMSMNDKERLSFGEIADRLERIPELWGALINKNHID